MLFNSPVYIFLFLPAAVFVYFFLTRKHLIHLSKVWLVMASLFFYGYWNPVYLILITASMLVNFFLGTTLHRTRGEPKPRTPGLSRRKIILLSGIVINLSLLGYFKYADFFIENINLLFSTGMPALNLALPLAISFFTFQQIAYLVDCYKEDTQEYDFLNYCLFVTFFPQLIAGPIVHHKQMMPQFMRLKNSLVNWTNIAAGIFIFSVGLFKKTVIADSFSVWANAGFDAGIQLSFFEAWGSSISYTLQIYYDFSGYTDMAIGAALLFNIRLPINFNSPYKALNIQDFWRRWHITLSTWLRDYIYIPLGGNRSGHSRAYLNILITFFLGGLWHGAGWSFIIWGALHGLAVAGHRLWSHAGLKMPVFLAWCSTIMFVNITWVFFRAENLESAQLMLKGMFDLEGVKFSPGFVDVLTRLTHWELLAPDWIKGDYLIPIEMAGYGLVFALVAFLLPNTVEMIRLVPYRGKLAFKTTAITAILTGMLFFFAVMTFIGNPEPSEFLYFNF